MEGEPRNEEQSTRRNDRARISLVARCILVALATFHAVGAAVLWNTAAERMGRNVYHELAAGLLGCVVEAVIMLVLWCLLHRLRISR
jgi:hypothetical protein